MCPCLLLTPVITSANLYVCKNNGSRTGVEVWEISIVTFLVKLKLPVRIISLPSMQPNTAVSLYFFITVSGFIKVSVCVKVFECEVNYTHFSKVNIANCEHKSW